MMPGLSGFDLTEKVRAASNVPILLLTARGLPEDRIEGLERGADDYLSKPFEPRELLLQGQRSPAPRANRAHNNWKRLPSAPAHSHQDGVSCGGAMIW